MAVRGLCPASCCTRARHSSVCLNEDGSRTYVYGTGFAWDKATGKFTAGTVTSIAHYDASGAYVDDLANVTSVSVKDLQAALEASAILPSDGRAPSSSWRAMTGWMRAGSHPAARSSTVTPETTGFVAAPPRTSSSAATAMTRFRASPATTSFSGNEGNDRLNGGDGNDVIYGDSTDLRLPGGDDLLRGGLGNDFRLMPAAATTGSMARAETTISAAAPAST